LIGQDGKPCLVHGDTAWSLVSALTREEVEQYLSNRAAKGFNSLIVNLIEHKFNGPVNRYGYGPFTVSGDFSTPNEAYFAHADWCMEKAAEYGIQVFLAPIYLGSLGGGGDEGWIHEVVAAGVETCRTYGRYVGERYGRFDNLVWMIGGDRSPGALLDHLDATVEGIQAFDRRHLFTAHGSHRSVAVEFGRGGWLDLSNTYDYGIVHRALLADYRRTPVLPFVLIESTYEGEHNASALQIRRQAYWAILCGACGQFFGNLPIWTFDGPGADMSATLFSRNEGHDEGRLCEGWQAALDKQGSWDMVHVRALFESRPWYDLVPDTRHVVVTRGLGEYHGLDYLTAARTSDGGTVIAYVPTARAVTVDLTRVSGERTRVWWFDPRTGEAHFAGEFATEGPQRFWPPLDGDWALVLDDASKKLAPPGASLSG
jgi:hypothetical protein